MLANNPKNMINSEEKQKANSTDKELEVKIDNGDLKLVDSLVESYGFKDRNSLFKFAIGALLEGNNNEGIFTIKTDSDNKKILSEIEPSADMLNSK